MPELKFARTRRKRRFEIDEEEDHPRIKFHRLSTPYPKRSLLGLVIMAGLVIYILIYLSKL